MSLYSRLATHLSEELGIEQWLILNALNSFVIKTPYCVMCNKSFCSQLKLESHISNSKAHKRVINRLVFKKTSNNIFYFQITDKYGNYKNKTTVDELVYDFITAENISVFMNRGGYAQICVNKKTMLLSRYIYFVILKKEKEIPGCVVDHINSDKLDNRGENLRQITSQQNVSNRIKAKNAKSSYYGVSRMHNKWKCSIEQFGRACGFYYHNELHAAYHYDLLVKQLDLQNYRKMNNIKKPADFVLQIREQKHKSPKIKYPSPMVILKNEDDIAIIKTTNGTEFLVDDEDYNKLVQYNWGLKGGYAAATVRDENGRKSILMSRMIMDCSDKTMIVDHINGNILDNRKINLRIITPGQNGRNKKITTKNTTGYIGVSLMSKMSNKWKYTLSFEGKRYYGSNFDNKMDAAKGRDKIARELNKNYHACFKLNFDNA